MAGSLFKAFGLKYYGPVDGHNVEQLVKTLNDIKKIPGPKLLHIVTIKGKGFAPAEKDPLKWHAQSSPFDKITGESLVKKSSTKSLPKYQDVFGDAIIELAEKDERIVGITAAMPSGTGLLKMMQQMPDRSFDVGIAEQHAVTFAAGLATRGIKPFVAIYSTFLQRGFDQVVHDCAIQKLPVVFCMDRAGLVGADGPTHHGCYDIPYLRGIPHIVLAAPMNEVELRDLMHTASIYEEGSFAIRYPRGAVQNFVTTNEFSELEIGKGRVLKEGDEGSTRRKDDLQVLLNTQSLTVTDKEYYYFANLPENYMQWKRVDVYAKQECCEKRRMTVYLAQEGDLNVLLRDKAKQPNFEWGETFCTMQQNTIRIYHRDFNVVSPILTYYRRPRMIEILNCTDPYTQVASPADVTCEFKDDVVELLIDEAVSIVAGDIELASQTIRGSQSAEKNN